jgi:general secretion pathway protein D
VIHVLRKGAVAVGILLAPLLAVAQPDQVAPNPPRRPIRTRPANQPAPVAAPNVAPAPGGPIDRSAGGEIASVTPDGLVNLDFEDVELAVVIDTIAKLTGKNFVYDDRVRGRVTIISPSPVPVDQAYTVFESVLQVKGFTTVEAPGGVIKVIPVRDAKETSIDTRRSGPGTPNTDRFVTRLIPLKYIDAEQISNTLKPLVSKEAALVSYAPTNTIILTDSASNIRRILSILDAIDVETFKEELALIRLQYADATVVAEQLSQLFGVEVLGVGGGATGVSRVRPRPQPVVPGQPTPGGQSPDAVRRGQVRIITDERTNSLVALASRSTLEEMRDFIRKLDVPVEGGGRIQVYYLKHADAEELADTLNSLLGGGGGGGGGQGGQGAPQIAGQVTEVVSGVEMVSADVATNSLLIEASPEGYQAILRVIEQLDIARPQVLVEALIMEVGLTDNTDLGFNGLLRLVNGATDIAVQSATDPAVQTSTAALLPAGPVAAVPFLTNFLQRTYHVDGSGNPTSNGSLIQGIIKAGATDNSINILSAPHILTSDNEEAEILVGNNIPIITSRLQGATATGTATASGLSTSVNVERQDIGVTLRVTPQITEGDTLRLEIFQEITDINNQIKGVGDVNQVGPALSNRRIENVVEAGDGDTIVIGGLIGDRYQDDLTKVPWLGEIPVLGWLFKTQSKSLQKANLLVFLTPHVIRGPDELVKQSIVKREEFRRRSVQALGESPNEDLLPDRTIGILGDPAAVETKNPARGAMMALDKRYPLERMLEIERQQATTKARERAVAATPEGPPRYLVLGGVFADSGVAQATLTRLIDAGYEGTLVSSRASGRVLLELRVGPYRELDEAERTAEALRRAYSLAPQVLVQAPEETTP